MHIIAIGEAFPQDWSKLLKGLQQRLYQLGSINGKVRELKVLDFVVEESVHERVLNDLTEFSGSKLSKRMDLVKDKWYMSKVFNLLQLETIKNTKEKKFNKKDEIRKMGCDPGNTCLYLNFVGKVRDKYKDGREKL